MKAALVQLISFSVFLSPAIASYALADQIYLESIPSSAPMGCCEIISYTSSGVGFAAIRFAVDEPVRITGTVANVSLVSGEINVFFAGIENLPSLTAVPSYTLAAGPTTLLAYSEAVSSSDSELLFPLDILLEPGSYALIVGCREFDCLGGLLVTTDPAQLLIPDEDFLLSYGTISSQNWNYDAPNFRLGLLTIPEPNSALLLGLGISGLTLLARRRLTRR